MPRRTLQLRPRERTVLVRFRDHDRRPYVRERAAALLKIADGMAPAAVAQRGLLRQRKPDTVYAWLDRFEQDGLDGLFQHPRRVGGFPPEQADVLRDALHHSPDTYGITHSRWQLADLRQVVPELATYSLSGLSHLLFRLGFRQLRGRLALHSPDPAYDVKLAWIDRTCALARAQPERVRLLYVDETHVQSSPTRAPVYAPRGSEPVTRLAPGTNLRQRYAGALDLVSGEVTWLSAMKVGKEHVCRLLRKLRRRSPTQQLIVVWDNWQTHLSAEVLFCAAAEAIELLWLPTYAPWTNPIEKLWRWLRQAVIHQHRWAADWTTLLAQVATFLNRFTDGSSELLHYVGLVPD